MRAVTRHIFMGILIFLFVYIVYECLTKKTVQGFTVKYARDCNCNPGYIPQKCGDPINAANEAAGGACVKDTYFCQPTLPGTVRTPCK
jgi:hypothetical protein